MRRRGLIALIASTVAIIAFGVYGVTSSPGAVVASPSPSPTIAAELAEAPASTPVPVPTPTTPAPSSPPQESPELTATRYFDAWQAHDISSMTGLVADPPADFAERHRSFDADLRVSSLSLTRGELHRLSEEAAEMTFQGVREVAGLGRWTFSSVLHLGLRAGAWKVLWDPGTLHPSLKDGESLRLKETQVRRPATLTREGLLFPRDSRAGDYVTGLGGTAVVLSLEEAASGRVLLASPPPPPVKTRSTISRSVQAAAARALDGTERPAAIVAVDVQTGQVRAVADTLGGRGAFNGLYPPGSTFKVVTAAALLRTGLTPESPVACPATYNIPTGKSFTDSDGVDHGTVTLTTAFALSCNTTFVQQTYERLRDDRLRAEAADRFGFREKPGLSSCRIQPYGTPDELGSDAIGQHSALASPLCMAEVAAAVASGVWRPAIMTAEPAADSPPPVPLDEGVAGGLRTMMSAVVTQGTAAQAGLPPETFGKTGTAEVEGAEDHAWFIGYRGSLAFAVFVQNGGAGGKVAAPIAARFLNAL
ncbi:NTF2-like N-terminal transpeptidase domain-containing protein [Streptosporangium subroseum]|uniref:NTF2-like N-terminal transpeptidase domain-containing protein n=1 Tax=Streptosporangium subroseum TaxID=106412 RepID=A0A239HKL1_9ACTN|nr:penicillin-binding transpeptidase domain-containing protein [Streptosporangium subroseum]SNS81887.1 NTF2-like N-terminal transpeptidase domain-containing protein [Streptosporangium subroseum]